MTGTMTGQFLDVFRQSHSLMSHSHQSRKNKSIPASTANQSSCGPGSAKVPCMEMVSHQPGRAQFPPCGTEAGSKDNILGPSERF